MDENISPRYRHSLTDRELEVLTLIDAGLSNSAIAEKLVISYHTVTWYVKQIFNKLGVNRRTQATAVARSLGLIDHATTDTPRAQYQHNLPTQLTSFIGRQSDIADIIHLLDNVNCRLVTLLGPGGIGKTRLAIEVANRKLDDFAHGVFFVPLQPLISHENILPTIAGSLGLKFQSDMSDPSRPLRDYLRDKSILLLIDNMEHLLEGVQVLSDLLAAGPDVKILVTSRESLNLCEEYIYHVRGLPFPEDPQSTSDESFCAVELFAERVKQICPDFSIEDSWSDVVKICQLVVGMPLAIELAVPWLKTLSCKEIAAEIQTGLDALVSPMRNAPSRHLSMKATFDTSWKLLNELEQRAFSCLSVFQGGFTREAAYQVAEADQIILQSLVDKSFIRRDTTSERYSIHELLRQYGEFQLMQEPETGLAVRECHCSYYIDLLASHRENVLNHRQQYMIDGLEPDLDNIRQAWQWVVTHAKVDDILRSVHTLAYFHVFRGRFLEEAEAFKVAIQSLDNDDATKHGRLAIAVLLSYLGWIYIRIGEPDRAQDSFLRSQSLYHTTRQIPPPGLGTEPLTGLAMLACIHGDYDEAEKLGKETCQVSKKRSDRGNLWLGEYAVISAFFHQGRYNAARELAEHWLMDSKASGATWSLGDPLNAMGNIARVMGDYGKAKAYYQESYGIRKVFNDPQGMAAARNFLGMTAVLENDIPAAKGYYEESYDLYNKVGDRGGAGYALCGLGTVALRERDYMEAGRFFYQALEIVATIHYVPVIFLALIGIGEHLIATGCEAKGIEILTHVRHHELSGQEARDRVSRILDGINFERYPDLIKRDKALSLDTVVQELLTTYG